MGDWYWIGVLAGVGSGLGVLFSGILAVSRVGLAAALALAVAAGVLLGFVVDDWGEALGGGLGALAGALGGSQILRGTLRRGGTRGGTALLFGGGGLLLAALALIPAAGYLEAIVVPALAARLRRRSPKRYAGLRTLAR